VNVLLTCAGRRNYLVRYFRQALGGRGQVFAADASPHAPALQEADAAYLVPSVDHPEYIDVLRSLCREHSVRLLLSLNDLELPVLAQHRNAFADDGTIAVVSSPTVISTCFDKWATCRWLQSKNVTAPRTYTTLADAYQALERGQVRFPMTVKPRWGTASIGIHMARDREDLDLYYRVTQRELGQSMLSQVSEPDGAHAILVQEGLEGDEFGLDIVNDLDGRYVCTFVKRKLAMRAGETDRAITVASADLQCLGQRIGRALGHVGNLDCDIFVVDGTPYVLEMNPRFGGGYPFSHAAGANIPAAIVAWAAEEPVDPAWLHIRSGVAAAKYYETIVTQPTSSQIRKQG
jgi:carbamoyl-phosphate synthase large subunit